ncbi:TetR/AcrR family transcriptional regulator [Mucilaginibacter daejeonensis]|uniref:TetR/AcrR family transcriptional regulator n=1 Tax=Mucilaginibacter daejeonensis TaxID=398049 RepID=UPI001D1734C4|nr:TetR/AcrR family transcriptional regulator [Mucilaginibacter daejeonensis]UEG52499.1 TetR/AcrR family transcriptional regulator [Mucilaginibacter daejeonensis]
MIAKHKHLPKATREQQIVDAADRVLLNVGVHDFTIDKMVTYLDVAKGTIYKYYKSKDDVLAEVSVKALHVLLKYFTQAEKKEQDPLMALRKMIMAFYRFYLEHPVYFELFIYMERPDFQSAIKSYLSVSSEIKNYFTAYLVRCQADGLIKKELDPTYCTYIIWGSCMGLMNFIEAKKVFIEDIVKLKRTGLLETYSEIIVSGMSK